MDSIGDFFYVLIAIAWLVYGYFNQKKKKDAQRRQQSPSSQPINQPQTEEKKDFATILDEILNEAKAKEEAQKQQTVERPAPSFREVEKPKPYEFGHYETMEDDIVDEEAAYEKMGTEEYDYNALEKAETEQNAIYKEDHPLEPASDEHYRTGRATADDDDFDIEKAVIFSEILKRPRF